MYTLLKPIYVREILLKKGVRVFTPLDFARIFQISASKTKNFLETQTNGGLFVRLKQGIYGLKTDLPGEEIIANALYKPSYISFEYALAYYNLIPEMPYTITSATTKPTRIFIANGQSFTYSTIKLEAYTGYSLIKVDRSALHNSLGLESFLLADPEKALVDYLYFVSIGKRMGNDRIDLESKPLNPNKLAAFAKLYNREKLMRLIEPYL
jgi:hypothetical protein